MIWRPLTILCDVDGVVADLHASWTARYNRQYQDDKTVEELFAEWGAPCCPVKCSRNQFYDILRQPTLYKDTEPIEGAKWAIDRLREQGHRVVFVTSCVDGTTDQKVAWLRQHGFLKGHGRHPGPDFASINDKGLVAGDVIIDDGVHNIEASSADLKILVDASHNENVELPAGSQRAYRWSDVIAIIHTYETNMAAIMREMDETVDEWIDEHVEQPADGPFGFPSDEAMRAGALSVTPLLEILPREIRTVSSTGGEKGVKPARFDLLPVGALWAIAEHFGKGASKYADRNWERGYEWSKSYAALLRHLTLWWGGEDHDSDSSFGEAHHLAAVGFHALALLTFALDERYKQFDNRPVAAKGEAA